MKKIFKLVFALVFITGWLMQQITAQTTFNYTGALQTYTVPAGVTLLKVEVWGAGGGGTNPGKGGYVSVNIPVTAGLEYQVYVGGKGSNGIIVNGGWQQGGNAGESGGLQSGTEPGATTDQGSGGGYSSVYHPSVPFSWIVAGGGGGSGGNNGGAGGNGGLATTAGGNGDNGVTGGGAGITGGVVTPGGLGCQSYFNGFAGITGGYGGKGYNCVIGGGGGGGGRYGGGGGGGASHGQYAGNECNIVTKGGGGGGGASEILYLTNPTGVTHLSGVNSGDGKVTITDISPPNNPTSITPTLTQVCSGSGTQLTANGVDGTIYWYTGSCSGGTEVSHGSNPITVNPATATTYYARNYKNGQFSAGCAFIEITIEPAPIAGSLAKTPNISNVCEETPVSAVLTSGGGGNGTDETQYRTYDGLSWTPWTTYSSGSEITTAGKTNVEIQTRRLGSSCPASAYYTVSWTVEKPPLPGSLVKTPGVMNVCEGADVSAALESGSGGNGTDELQSRTNNGTAWSAWASYTSGASISTTGKTAVEIQTSRLASYCNPSSYVTVSWTVEKAPLPGSLAKTPDVMNVCEGVNVTATLTAGTGGNGTDELQSRTNNGTAWSSWATYTSGAAISTTGKTAVEIQTRRLASYCSSTAYVTVSWTVEKTPYAGSLTKTPEVINVCEGTNVSAALTAGLGGNDTDELQSRTNNGTAWSSWATYTSGAAISTTGKTAVEIQTRRLATYCSPSAYVSVSWTVEATAYPGSLTKTPEVMNVCEGTNVSAALKAGLGGNGIDELQSRTNNGTSWSSWATYTSGAAISTTGKTAVEVQTRRLASYCSSTAYVTVSWTVEKTPNSGSLTKNPDATNVCQGSNISATLIAGIGGNGTDITEYRTQTGTVWSGWAAYVSGNTILTSGLSGVEVHTYRTADYCDDAATATVSWIVDPTTIAGGIVNGGVVVCYGLNSTPLTLTGYIGGVQRWEWSTDGTNWNPIANTVDTYTATNLVNDTWFRAVVKSGSCLLENSVATRITMFSDYHISGYARYNNNPQTPLNGLKITLKQGGTAIRPAYITGTTGFYEFTGLINGTYTLEVASANPAGWLTWNGVNNTDYLLAAKHVAGTSLLPDNPPVVKVAASVKAPHPAINSTDVTAIQYAAKYGWGYFDIPKWVFSGMTTATGITDFQLSCSDVTRDIRGLCSGDINGSYLPTFGLKEAMPGLEVANRGLLAITPEITFPVKAESDMEIGAITLMLDFDASLTEITAVEMPVSGADQPWFQVKDNMLYIGWMSLNPVKATANEPLLLIHAHPVSTEIRNPKSEIRIHFTLNESPLSELADADGNVIDGAKLAIADAGHASPVTRHEDMLSVYPNPVSDLLNIEYLMESDGIFSMELMNPQGIVLIKTDKANASAGLNKTTMNLQKLPNGAYLLKGVCGESTKTVKVIVNR